MGPELSNNEKNVIAYHRQHIRDKTYMVNTGEDPNLPKGTITTFYGARIPIDPNKPNGPVQIVPTYWDGKILKTDDEIRAAVRNSGIKFPVYNTDAQAARREMYMHNIMEKDIKAMGF